MVGSYVSSAGSAPFSFLDFFSFLGLADILVRRFTAYGGSVGLSADEAPTRTKGAEGGAEFQIHPGQDLSSFRPRWIFDGTPALSTAAARKGHRQPWPQRASAAFVTARPKQAIPAANNHLVDAPARTAHPARPPAEEMMLSTRTARERRNRMRTDTSRARRHHKEDGRGYQPGTNPSKGRTGGTAPAMSTATSKHFARKGEASTAVIYQEEDGWFESLIVWICPNPANGLRK